MTIYFYGTRDKYGCFSNFSRHGFELDGVYWLTSEHYFQAQKFVGTPHADQIRQVKTPKDAARMGRDRTEAMLPIVQAYALNSGLKAHLNNFDCVSIRIETGEELPFTLLGNRLQKFRPNLAHVIVNRF